MADDKVFWEKVENMEPVADDSAEPTPESAETGESPESADSPDSPDSADTPDEALTTEVADVPEWGGLGVGEVGTRPVRPVDGPDTMTVEGVETGESRPLR